MNAHSRFVDLEKKISVVIPVYRGEPWIQGCLNSMARQTLARDRFEILLAFNGPEDGARNVAENFFRSEPDLLNVMLQSTSVNAAGARNDAAKMARFDYLTWVDVDDTISPEYLELMLLGVENGKVPFAQIVNVSPSGVHDLENLINSDFFKQSRVCVEPADFPRALTFMTSKVVPTVWARMTPLDTGLASGEDVAFYGELLSIHEFQLSLLPAAAGATYYRQLLNNSVSRGRTDFDFMVRQRADVIESLGRSLERCRTKSGPVIRSFMASQASFIKRYVEVNEHERTAVLDYLTCRRIPQFPWHVLRKPVQELVVAYNFAPYSDTGAVVASKRIRSRGSSVDVISNSMGSARESLEDNLVLSQPYVARLAELKAPTTFASANGIEKFVELGLNQYDKWIKSGRRYESVYSRTMWPASHFLAASLKLRNKDLFWRAEFSDPVKLNIEGVLRESPIPRGAFEEHILKDAESDFSDMLLDDLDVYSWTENLAYALADELVFTNEHQKSIMLSYAPRRLRSRIELRSTVSAHPTLPRAFYGLSGTADLTRSDTVNIAYFGEFYSTRGLSEVGEAIAAFEPDIRNKLRLHIFSSSREHTSGSGDNGTEDIIVAHSKLAYLDFLQALDQFDCLIVNDAVTADHHALNPYLPSKYSDYSGSQTKIWSIVEPGSILSGRTASFKSEIGNVEQAAAVLQQLIG